MEFAQWMLGAIAVIAVVGGFLLWLWIGAHVWHALDLPTWNQDQDLPRGAKIGHEDSGVHMRANGEEPEILCARCRKRVPDSLFDVTVCRGRAV